jgi:osmotically-inducible protein OsmY
MTEATEQDRYVEARVREALASDARTNELGIEVAVAGGKVHLSGTTATRDRKKAIGQVAREVLGDRDVVNEVTVPELFEPATAEEL